jgi:hypothetical protein
MMVMVAPGELMLSKSIAWPPAVPTVLMVPALSIRNAPVVVVVPLCR